MRLGISVKLLHALLFLGCFYPAVGQAQSDLELNGILTGLPANDSIHLHFVMKNTDQVFTIAPVSFVVPLRKNGSFFISVPYKWSDNQRNVSLRYNKRVLWEDSLSMLCNAKEGVGGEGIQVTVNHSAIRTLSGAPIVCGPHPVNFHFIGGAYDKQDLQRRGGVDQVLRDLMIPCNLPMQY